MRVLITGIDGYLGWPLALRLGRLGYDVAGVDLGFRRQWVNEVGGGSAFPIADPADRRAAYRDRYGATLRWHSGDLTDPEFVRGVYEAERPDAVVYLGEQPSAPYSMIDLDHAVYTQRNNVIGTLVNLYAIREFCPEAHLLKLGTMGEYGTPDCDIPEGCFPLGSYWQLPRCLGEKYPERQSISGLMFPRRAGSWYHLSKVHDTYNVEFACRNWGLRSTDVMQGPVYGAWVDEMEGDDRLRTRMDFDECFGTVINRFCVQAMLGIPLTVYGEGGQTRGYLPLEDSLACMVLCLENPPKPGEYRTFNQFDQTYTINDLADLVQDVAGDFNLSATVESVPNPRNESERHRYCPDSCGLRYLGYEPIGNLREVIRRTMRDLIPHRNRLGTYQPAVMPKTRWI